MDGQDFMRTRFGPLVVLLSLVLHSPTALATSKNYYDTDVVIQEPVAEEHRAALAIEVYKNLSRSKIQHVTIRGSAVGNLERAQLTQESIASLPLSVMLALRLACLHANPFSTWNILVPHISGDLFPVNLTRPDKTHLVIEVGDAFRPDAFGLPPNEAELRRRYGIGPLGSYGRTWSPEQRHALDQALGLLMLEERQFIADIAFERRSHSGMIGRGKHVADYFQRGDVAKIYLYDSAFEHDMIAFIGTPSTPYRNSVFGILHEIGHLLAAVPSLRSYQRALELQRAYDGLYASYEEIYNEHLQAIETLNQADKYREPLAAHVEHTVSRVEDFEAKLEAALERTRRANRQGLRYQSNSPVVEAYKRIRTNKSGPTAYGRTDISEGFAESFAIYHTDPQALRWIDPQVYQWFRDGGHLAAIASTID